MAGESTGRDGVHSRAAYATRATAWNANSAVVSSSSADQVAPAVSALRTAASPASEATRLNAAQMERVIARLRQERPGLPALIVSGYTGGDTIDTASLGDNTALLQKPFTPAALSQKVRDVLAKPRAVP